jgi:predicted deacylase
VSPPIYTALDIDALPQGQVSKILVDIAHTPVGEPLRLAVLVARGTRPGPVVGLTAAVHGNELNGIPVIHKLFQKLDPKQLRGSVVGVPIVNLPGYLARTRLFNDQRDLNHRFPGIEGGDASSAFAFRIMDRLVRHFDRLIDLHTASAGRVNSLYIRADMTVPEAARMAYWTGPQIIVHNPAGDGTLRGAAMALGIPAITVEIGNPHRFHDEYVKRSLGGVRAVLSDLGMVPFRHRRVAEPPVLCERSYWMHADRGGLLRVAPQVTDNVVAGEEVASMVDVFGDATAAWTAPEDGVVIGRAVDPVAWTGARILHLGVVAHPDDPRFLRRWDEV